LFFIYFVSFFFRDRGREGEREIEGERERGREGERERERGRERGREGERESAPHRKSLNAP
jgi:hypothetical protein